MIKSYFADRKKHLTHPRISRLPGFELTTLQGQEGVTKQTLLFGDTWLDQGHPLALFCPVFNNVLFF